MAGGAETPKIAALPAIVLIGEGSLLGSDSDLMMFSAELAILQRGNQDHASRHSNFVACAEWVGYRERK
jgi:hypothetical protein